MGSVHIFLGGFGGFSGAGKATGFSHQGGNKSGFHPSVILLCCVGSVKIQKGSRILRHMRFASESGGGFRNKRPTSRSSFKSSRGPTSLLGKEVPCLVVLWYSGLLGFSSSALVLIHFLGEGSPTKIENRLQNKRVPSFLPLYWRT